MTSLEKLLTELETARLNATKGPWTLDAKDGDWLNSVESEHAKTHFYNGTTQAICALDDGEYIVNENKLADATMIALGANHILQLIEIIRVQNEALNVLEDILVKGSSRSLILTIANSREKVEAIAKGEA